MQAIPTEEYLRQYDRYTEEFLNTFSRFDKRRFNAPRAAGKWSPGQMLDHLNLAERATLRLFAGETSDVEGRGPDEKCADIMERWAKNKRAFPAPANLSPREVTYPLVETLDVFVDQRADIRTAVDFASDVGAIIGGWAHPLFGEMTLLEWLVFTAAHGERHRRQYVSFSTASPDESLQFAPRATVTPNGQEE